MRKINASVVACFLRGFFTNTTKERLNALPGVNIVQKLGKWYLNGVLWDGTLTNIDYAKDN